MKTKYSDLNSNDPFGGIEPPAHRLETKWINVNGRKEHEAIIKDAEKCQQLGLDQIFEKMVYLNRWGGWLKDGEE